MARRNGLYCRPSSSAAVEPPRREGREERHRREVGDVRPGEPARLDLAPEERHPQAHDRHRDDHADEEAHRHPPRPELELAGGLHDAPGRAEKPVAEDQRDAGQEAEGREEIEGAAGEGAAVVGEALHEGAEHHALREGRDERAVMEGVVPDQAASSRP